MKRNFLRMSLLIVLFLLQPACLIDQNAPEVKANPYVGVIGLEDSTGVESGALFYALFGTSPSPSKALSLRYQLLATQKVNWSEHRGTEPVCRFSQVAKKNSNGSGDTTNFISVGSLSFGNQSAYVNVKADAMNRYAVALAPGFPSGTYLVLAQGTEKVPKFEETIDVPPVPKKVTINGFDFTDPAIALDHNSQVSLQWAANWPPNGSVEVLLDFVQEDAATQSDLQCVIREVDAPIDQGFSSLQINPSNLSQLTPGKGTKLYFARVTLRADATPPVTAKIQAMRTISNTASIR